MHQLVGERGQVLYGCIEGPVRFNHEDFVLRSFFGRRLGPWRRRLAQGAFTYLGILGEGYVVGLAAVRRPAPIARITVAAPVTMSPPA